MFDAKPSHSPQKQIARRREQTSGHFIPPVPALNSHSIVMAACTERREVVQATHTVKNEAQDTRSGDLGSAGSLRVCPRPVAVIREDSREIRAHVELLKAVHPITNSGTLAYLENWREGTKVRANILSGMSTNIVGSVRMAHRLRVPMMYDFRDRNSGTKSNNDERRFVGGSRGLEKWNVVSELLHHCGPAKPKAVNRSLERVLENRELRLCALHSRLQICVCWQREIWVKKSSDDGSETGNPRQMSHGKVVRDEKSRWQIVVPWAIIRLSFFNWVWSVGESISCYSVHSSPAQMGRSDFE
ncbi:hypothetical protein B0T20DRAFT_468673 [Sordaria brevicollis]|uniref:Uncharacterized protein n=1 Tax=Sordaria brevicollis TaxID=83679 RepID=A0AAE0PFN8_SORBR|nr:hypothetical protein B0T20DRAFT_468673 [Sordaria brevicollis]